MDTISTLTPFGRRPMTLGQMAKRIALDDALASAALPGSNAPAAVNKWQLFRTLTEIRERLGLSDRTLSVLNALLSFQQETALSLPRRVNAEEEGGPAKASCELVVFPSNKALSLRAHGMAAATLRRHLAALVEAGLIVRRDSPNGKRYARKAGASAQDEAEEHHAEAFGFDLTPLVVHAPAFDAIAEEVRRERRAAQLLRERISLHRRDIAKLIACGLEEGAPGDWSALERRLLALPCPPRRTVPIDLLERLAADLRILRDDTLKLLSGYVIRSESSANESQFERLHSSSNHKKSLDLEPAFQKSGGEALPSSSHREAPERKAYPLAMVVEACPDLRDYAPGGRITGWDDLIAAAALVRPMLGVSPDAWQHALAALGHVEAHIAIATILQRSEHSSEAVVLPPDDRGRIATLVNGSPAIRSAGGYLRALTAQAQAGGFSLGPVLMALIGQRLKARRAAG